MLVFCVDFYRYKVQWSTLELILQCLILQYKWQCPHPNPSHCEGFSNVPFLSALRSGLLTFFSSLVIQESLINCVGERRRSGITSHCEVIPGFCLSPSYPEVELGLTGLTSTSRSRPQNVSRSLRRSGPVFQS